jgi:Tfp pilus assembly protein PilF
VVVEEEGTNKPIKAAKVILKLARDPSVQPPAGTTNNKGKFSMLGLKDGTWILRIEAQGFHNWEDTLQVFSTGSPDTTRVFMKRLPAEVVEAQQRFAAQGNLDKGKELEAAGDLAGARAEYERALVELQDKDKPVVLAVLATTYLNEANYAKAREIYEQALAIEPAHIPSLKGMCALVASEGDMAKAEEILTKIPETEQIHPNTLMNIAMGHYNNGEMKEAKVFLDRVVRDNPEVAQAYYFRGLVGLSLTDQEQAVTRADFEKFIELSPDSPQAKEAQEYIGYLKPAE